MTISELIEALRDITLNEGVPADTEVISECLQEIDRLDYDPDARYLVLTS